MDSVDNVDNNYDNSIDHKNQQYLDTVKKHPLGAKNIFIHPKSLDLIQPKHVLLVPKTSLALSHVQDRL